MGYQKQNFANGEVLSASQLNHIEQGIVDVESDANKTKAVVDKIIDPTLSLSGKAADAKAAGDAVSQIKEDLGEVATFETLKPNFISGVLLWNSITSIMKLMENEKRASADLRFLELGQGDTVGITDYSTYSIAFGDNFEGWYGGGYHKTDITANSSTILPYIILVKRNDEADMTEKDFESLKNQFHSSKKKYSAKATKEFAETVSGQLDIPYRANNYVHISFDDVSLCIKNLSTGKFKSVWNEPFFEMLLNLHDKYGAVFSLYIWDVQNLANVSNKYRKEFILASDWLKFGFHATNEGSLENATYESAKTEYNNFVDSIYNVCGGINSIDRMPRLNYFASNLEACKALRDAKCGCIGFLNSDDSRKAYYLEQTQLDYLRTHSLYSDRTNGLQFVSTVMRLDWFVNGFSSQYKYNKPVKNNPYDELVYRYNQPDMGDLYSNLIVFTHEWQTYTTSYVLKADMVRRIEEVCKFANEYHYNFDFPQNRVQNITSYSV